MSTCTVCGDIKTDELPTIEHTKSEWTVAEKAGLFTAGKEQVTCTICGEVLEENVIPQTCPVSLAMVVGIGVVVIAVGGGVFVYIKKRK